MHASIRQPRRSWRSLTSRSGPDGFWPTDPFGFRIWPGLRMQRRFEFVRAEDSERGSGRRHSQDQSDLKTRPLEIGDANLVDSAGEGNLACPFFRRMLTVVVDDELIVDIEPR